MATLDPRVHKEREVLMVWPGLPVQQASRDSRVIEDRTAFLVPLVLQVRMDDLEIQVLEAPGARMVLPGQLGHQG